MRVRLLRPAIADLRQIVTYIERDNPWAAKRLVQGTDASLERIADTGFIEMARAGRRPGTRELVHGSYIISYRYDEAADEIVVLSVVHGARRR